MDRPPQQANELQPAQAKFPWERPLVTLLGNLRALVQGGGKSGPNADSDPQSTRKTGVG